MSALHSISESCTVHNTLSILSLLAGFDDEALEDELIVEDLDENQIVEFWEDLDDFPFDPKDPPQSDEDKKAFILDLILKLKKDPNIHFGVNIPTC